jgi:hypothetical protein
VFDQAGRAAAVHGDDRQAAGLRLEDHLAERLDGAGEQEDVGGRVDLRQRVPGSIVVTYPASDVARGLGDAPEAARPLVATLWGQPQLAPAMARLADGTPISWRRGRWSLAPSSAREVTFREVP